MSVTTDGPRAAGAETGELSSCVALREHAMALAAAITMANSIGATAQSRAVQDEIARVIGQLAAAHAGLAETIAAAQTRQVGAAMEVGTPLRLHIGPGGAVIDGWVGVDLAGSDVVADLRQPLPFPDDSVSHIYASHVLEHLRNPDESYFFLAECRRVLRIGGKIRIVVPNIAVYLRACAENDDGFWRTHQQTWPWSRVEANRLDQTLRYAGAGSGDHNFFGHRHGYDQTSLADVLGTAGFSPTRPCAYQASKDEVFRIDDRSWVAHVQHNGTPLSLFAEGFNVF